MGLPLSSSWLSDYDGVVSNLHPATPMHRRKFLTATAASVAAPFLNIKASVPSDQPLPMVFYTDIHARVEWETPQAMSLAADHINQLKPELVLCGGDCITDGFQASPESVEPRWEAYMHMHRQIEAPVQAVIGNHDLCGARPKDGSTPAIDPRRVFREKMNLASTYRSFNFRGLHFILLDSFEVLDGEQPYRGFIGPAQMEWLIKNLERVPREQPIILLTHMPLLTVFFQATRGSTVPNPNNRVVENGREVLKLFRERNLVAVLQGHLHVHEVLRWQGVPFITGGAVCGKWWRGDWYGTQEGFLRLIYFRGRVHHSYQSFPWDARRPADQ